MEKIPLEKGTVKVVWLSNQVNKVHSKMFDDLKSAREFAKTIEDFLMFKLLTQKDYKDYSWEILPYGNYNLYKTLIEFYKKHKKRIPLFIKKFIENGSF